MMRKLFEGTYCENLIKRRKRNKCNNRYSLSYSLPNGKNNLADMFDEEVRDYVNIHYDIENNLNYSFEDIKKDLFALKLYKKDTVVKIDSKEKFMNLIPIFATIVYGILDHINVNVLLILLVIALGFTIITLISHGEIKRLSEKLSSLEYAISIIENVIEEMSDQNKKYVTEVDYESRELKEPSSRKTKSDDKNTSKKNKKTIKRKEENKSKDL